MEYFGRKLPEVLQRTFSCLFLKRQKMKAKVKTLKVCFIENALKTEFCGFPVLLSTICHYSRGQSESCVLSCAQGIQLYSKAFVQAIASNRRQPERWRKPKHKRLLVIYKSKKRVYKNPRALDLQRPGETKTWSLWSISSPLSRSILTVSYCPLIAALCRGPLDAYFKKITFIRVNINVKDHLILREYTLSWKSCW